MVRKHRMKMTRKTPEEHNKLLDNRRTKPDGMPAQVWNNHLDALKRLGKYNGEIYARTRTVLDEMWEVEEDIGKYNRGEP